VLTNPSPPSQQRRLQSPLSAISQFSFKNAHFDPLLLIILSCWFVVPYRGFGRWNGYRVSGPPKAFQKPGCREPFEKPRSRQTRRRLTLNDLQAFQNCGIPFQNHVIFEDARQGPLREAKSKTNNGGDWSSRTRECVGDVHEAVRVGLL
jgi:hypothetical protein